MQTERPPPIMSPSSALFDRLQNKSPTRINWSCVSQSLAVSRLTSVTLQHRIKTRMLGGEIGGPNLCMDRSLRTQAARAGDAIDTSWG